MIDGVNVKKLRVIPDERGRLMEILRADDKDFTKFGQVYMTTCHPGVVKGWHYHHKQTDYMTAIIGMVKIVLYDNRDDSPTHGEVNEFFVGQHNPIRVTIPPGVCHGFKGISNTEAIIINTVTEPYDYENPDEHRIHPHNNDIPYKWERKDG
ncbi:dTDP-4-dehydrorhamnose 3,5-epimerase family protein [bacterium]|nr:dTDP-4-dehydrorhamnose 3,5-epimerase family protein [bacterium]